MQHPLELSTHLWLILTKAYQAIREHDLQSIESTGLCLSDFSTLEVLFHKGPLPVNAIGEKVHLTSGSTTAAVDRLEKKKLVARQLSPTDRRLRLVQLTPAGQTLVENIFESHQQALHRATAGLNTEEKLLLIDLLKKLGKEAQRQLNTQNIPQ